MQVQQDWLPSLLMGRTDGQPVQGNESDLWSAQCGWIFRNSVGNLRTKWRWVWRKHGLPPHLLLYFLRPHMGDTVFQEILCPISVTQFKRVWQYVMCACEGAMRPSVKALLRRLLSRRSVFEMFDTAVTVGCCVHPFVSFVCRQCLVRRPITVGMMPNMYLTIVLYGPTLKDSSHIS